MRVVTKMRSITMFNQNVISEDDGLIFNHEYKGYKLDGQYFFYEEWLPTLWEAWKNREPKMMVSVLEAYHPNTIIKSLYEANIGLYAATQHHLNEIYTFWFKTHEETIDALKEWLSFRREVIRIIEKHGCDANSLQGLKIRTNNN